jgi:hypothetical protein
MLSRVVWQKLTDVSEITVVIPLIIDAHHTHTFHSMKKTAYYE